MGPLLRLHDPEQRLTWTRSPKTHFLKLAACLRGTRALLARSDFFIVRHVYSDSLMVPLMKPSIT